MSKVLVICGATASGKTSLSVACAKAFNGEIISADSMLVYTWQRMDPTFAAAGREDSTIAEYIDNSVEYTTKYIY